MDKHVTFVSNDITVKLTAGTDAKILSIDGIASIDTEHDSISNPYIAGSQVNHIHDKTANTTLEVLIPVSQRSFYLGFFRINSTGTITIKYGDVERFTDYIVSKSDVKQDTYKDDLTIKLTLARAYPYWKDVYGFGENLGDRIPMLWPGLFRLRDDVIIASYTKFDRKYAVTNTGEVPVGFYMQIKTTESATNPKIILADKENVFIRIGTDNRPITIQRNDLLEISTIVENGNTPDSGKDMYVLLNGENILNLTDQFSTFFQIEPGQHQITYDADAGVQTLQIWLWRNWAWSWV